MKAAVTAAVVSVLVVTLAVAAAGLFGLGAVRSLQPSLPPLPAVGRAPTPTPGPFRPAVEVVATHLEIPWALAFAPDGRLFFTERPGRLRLIASGQLLPDPVATLPAATAPQMEGGLMGLALDPDFQRNGYLYVMYTYRDRQGRLRNRISRLTLQGNQAGAEKVLLDGIPGGSIHDGGRLKFGPDGTLYATVGETSDPSLAQNPASLGGKVLRINPDGSIPADNPIPGSPIFTLGHRNPQGLAFQPGTGRLFSTEHGTGANDEVNVLEAGRNYGWPLVQGIAREPRFADPIVAYTPTIAPSGATFYDGDRLPGWRGDLFFTSLKGSHLRRLVLGGTDSRQVLSDESLLDGRYGRLRDVVQGPDGYLYLATNNRDGRSTPAPEDDRILRLVPQ